MVIYAIEKNVWRSGYTKELSEAMRLCGCDKRFTDGTASDYECLCELARVSYLLRGHDALCFFVRGVKKELGYEIPVDCITVENTRAIWQKSSDLVAKKSWEENKNIVEKYNISQGALVLNDLEISGKEYYAFLEGIKSELVHNCKHIFVNLASKDFVSPNPYLAKRIYDACEILQDDILLCQVICEICLDKSCRKTKIYIDTNGNLQYADKLMRFFEKHKMHADIRFVVNDDLDVKGIYEICLLTGDIVRVSPAIKVMKNNIFEKTRSFISELSKIYPIGMIEFIE